jgi:hypothetical protein
MQNPLTRNWGPVSDALERKNKPRSIRIVNENPEPEKPAPDFTIKVTRHSVASAMETAEMMASDHPRQIPIAEGECRIIPNPRQAKQSACRLFSGSGGRRGLRIISEVAAAHVIVLDYGREIVLDAVIGASAEVRYINGRSEVAALYRARIVEGGQAATSPTKGEK